MRIPAVVTAVSKVAFNQKLLILFRPGGRVVAVGLPSEMMDLSIVKTVLDGIQVIGSLVGTRKDLEEAFQFGAEGLVVPVVQKRPVSDAVDVFDEMEAGTIQDVWYLTSHTNAFKACQSQHLPNFGNV